MYYLAACIPAVTQEIMPTSDNPEGTAADPSHGRPQETAFKELCDAKTSELLIPIGSGPGREALLKLNRATEETFRHLSHITHYTVGSTLSQGACLLVAVLSELELMVPAWSGPPAQISQHAVQILQGFSSRAGMKVRVLRAEADTAEGTGVHSPPCHRFRSRNYVAVAMSTVICM